MAEARRLVEEREARVDLAELDARATLSREGEHLAVAIADARCELVRLVEECDCALVVALREHRGERLDEPEACMLRSLGEIREQPLGFRQPAVRDRERATGLVVPLDRQRHSRRPEQVTGGRVRGVRPLAERDRLVELPAPPGRLAVVLEVGRGQTAVAGLANAP